jgi:hypothetical protein
MELKDLKQDITQMPTDELEALLKDMRQSRRTPKKIHVDKQTKTAKPQGSGPDLATLMKAMSPADMLALLLKNKKE